MRGKDNVILQEIRELATVVIPKRTDNRKSNLYRELMKI